MTVMVKPESLPSERRLNRRSRRSSSMHLDTAWTARSSRKDGLSLRESNKSRCVSPYSIGVMAGHSVLVVDDVRFTRVTPLSKFDANTVAVSIAGLTDAPSVAALAAAPENGVFCLKQFSWILFRRHASFMKYGGGWHDSSRFRAASTGCLRAPQRGHVRAPHGLSWNPLGI